MMARGQSLSLGANFGAELAPNGQRWRDVFGGAANPGALMLTGLKRVDGVAVANVANPLLNGYDTSVQASGAGPMLVQTSIPEGAVLACGLLREGLAPQGIAFQFHDAGGQSIENLDDDGASGTSGLLAPWQNGEWWLTEAARVFAAQGSAVRVPRLFLNQGEADVARPRGWWLAAARSTLADWHDQIQRLTGQAAAPKLFLQQTGGYMHGADSNLHDCKLDQLDLVREQGGVLIGPLYPYKIDNADGKGVHKLWSEYVRAYEVGVWAAAEDAAGRAWNLLPGTPVREGDRITIPVSVRGDESLTTVGGLYAGYGGDPANLGLEAIGGGAITAASVSGGEIIVDVAGTVTGLRYAMQRSATDYRTLTDASGCGYGAHRGLIRSTLTRSVTWGGQVFVLERWLPSFEVALA
ncbi:hypothetical protein [Paracoccus sp. DMF]|uniref:hypothetical protein n=1 Tax=Paracoccus sp. DMF TaxID=400837 RepID=UPI0021E41B76|nr:hypothetical protein [Paracoccus sp. DMF]MCV2447911.1 hypothetical protein [Paracoccus sp. DMF]